MASTNNKHEYTMGHSKATISSHESRTVDSDASFVLPYIQPIHRILDVGCGPGTITTGFVPFASLGEVIGVDYSSEIINHAKEVAKSRGLGDKVKFIQADLLETLPFEDNSFDVVFASQVFQHLRPEQNAIIALKECRRVLKPGGLLAIRDGAAMHFHPYGAEIDRIYVKNMILAIGGPDFSGMYHRGWLRKAGFDVEDSTKVRLGAGTTVYADRKSCKLWADRLSARLGKGDKYRESWLKAGVPEHECDEAAELVQKWAESDDAFYGMLQAESLAWK
ncbi:uncharacterized protein PV09_06262 [Verruconis gallopava]|uniref:Methyltransferase type 11 domain-containing protein n=1 Tax=Verruconis gallopava TaxID=253628 RepID=A0A0D1YP60_9PEZI|nr:uncharacterized protein PV09_06262 [Verruconis gallopava]KIW02452.1 hypothetical protein PV09_06262 [Verruconis gallopava]